MDTIPRQKLETLLAALPAGTDRERIATEFARSSTPLSARQTPEAHAAAVVAALEAHRADLTSMLRFLADQHPTLRTRIDRVAVLFVAGDTSGAEDEPTEMIDPALLATLRSAGTPQLGNRKTLTSPSPASSSAATGAPSQRRAAPRPASAPSTPPPLPRGQGALPSPQRGQVSPAVLAAGVLALLVVAAVLGIAALR